MLPDYVIVSLFQAWPIFCILPKKR